MGTIRYSTCLSGNNTLLLVVNEYMNDISNANIHPWKNHLFLRAFVCFNPNILNPAKITQGTEYIIVIAFIFTSETGKVTKIKNISNKNNTDIVDKNNVVSFVVFIFEIAFLNNRVYAGRYFFVI